MKINPFLDAYKETSFNNSLCLSCTRVLFLNAGKNIKQEEERAVNQVLQKEVERLEEERLELKQQIRKLAQHTGQR